MTFVVINDKNGMHTRKFTFWDKIKKMLGFKVNIWNYTELEYK